jgi:hypothetical protein
MEFDAKKSKALKISLVVLAGIILLVIGAAIGAHTGRYGDYSNYRAKADNYKANSFECGARENGALGGRKNHGQGVCPMADASGACPMLNQADNIKLGGQGQFRNPLASTTINASSTK